MASQDNSQSLRVTFGGYSCAGRKSDNQDAFAALPSQGAELNHKGMVAVIADGVSSAARAGEAAQLAVTASIEEYLQTPYSWSVSRSMAKVMAGLNQWMYSQAAGYEQSCLQAQHYLTTFSSVVFKSSRAHVFHVGDSRIYRIRGQDVECLTRDHSRGHQLTRALGGDLHLEMDALECDLEPGDLWLLVTDGVYEYLDIAAIRRLVAQPQHDDLEALARALVALAYQNHSQDNLSCLLARVEQVPNRSVDQIHQALSRRKIPPVLEVGQKLDGYRVLRKLHASPRSYLYLVQGADDEAPVVLKAPSPNYADDPLYLQGFIREAWVGQQMNHPNVMRVLSAAENSPFLYHICEYVQGQPLSDWVEEHPKPKLAEVRSIITQCIQALRCFQRLDMVHRDLKPDNLLINAHGQVTLVDYGSVSVASWREHSDNLTEFYPQGSADYCAPEVLLGQEADFRSDMFALGVMAYELLCGQRPYPDGAHRFRQFQQWRYRSIKQYRPELPFWFDLTLKQATAPEPEQRFAAFSEFSQALSRDYQETTGDKPPLLERDPVLFWQGLCALLLLVLILSHSLG